VDCFPIEQDQIALPKTLHSSDRIWGPVIWSVLVATVAVATKWRAAVDIPQPVIRRLGTRSYPFIVHTIQDYPAHNEMFIAPVN